MATPLKVFINYRRADDPLFVELLGTHFMHRYGEANVFIDWHGIPDYVDFADYLKQKVRECDVIVPVIGSRWLELMRAVEADGEPDYVRIELEEALRLNKVITPVRIKGADVPPSRDLPPELRPLFRMQIPNINGGRDMLQNVGKLMDSIERAVATRNTQSGKRSADLMPAPFAWINIPAGNVTLENTWDDDENVYLKKNEPQTFPLAPFAIAKYPVTNAQFAVFIAADGYQNKAWWTDAGWAQRKADKWTQPDYWTDADRNGADHPVVGVSWYEAVAFCRWLSETSGDRVRLPTEQEWQWAAQSDDGRTYSWGDEWDCTRCNNSVDPCDSLHTTLVTQYEGKAKGDSFFKVTDMAGNVWEWCLTEYQNGKHAVNIQTEYRVLRGGSLNCVSFDLFRCDFRFMDNPSNGDYDRGFRLAISI